MIRGGHKFIQGHCRGLFRFGMIFGRCFRLLRLRLAVFIQGQEAGNHVIFHGPQGVGR